MHTHTIADTPAAVALQSGCMGRLGVTDVGWSVVVPSRDSPGSASPLIHLRTLQQVTGEVTSLEGRDGKIWRLDLKASRPSGGLSFLTWQRGAVVCQSATLRGWLCNRARCCCCIDLRGNSVHVCKHTRTRGQGPVIIAAKTLTACEIKDMIWELSRLWLTDKNLLPRTF